MTSRLLTLATITLLGAVSVADAQGPDPQLSVFVAAAPGAKLPAGTAYEAASPEDLAGSVEDVKRAITGAGIRGRRKHLILVDSPSDAQVIVELRARRSAFGVGLFGRFYSVLFAIKPGPRVATEQFAAIPPDARHDKLGAGASADAPEWLSEGAGRGSWKVAGAVVASVVDRFAEDHAAALAKSVADAQ